MAEEASESCIVNIMVTLILIHLTVELVLVDQKEVDQGQGVLVGPGHPRDHQADRQEHHQVGHQELALQNHQELVALVAPRELAALVAPQKLAALVAPQ